MNGFNLLDYLCVGKPNAIKNKELATLLSTNERCITIAVNALRKRGEIICSDANGFYLPADDECIPAITENSKHLARSHKACRTQHLHRRDQVRY